MLAWRAIESQSPEALRMIPDLIGAMATLFLVPAAVLGVSAWHRGQLQREKVPGRVRRPGLLARILK
jgi:hypothetical protein